MAENPRKIRLDGQRFGRWNVIRQQGNAPRGGAMWLCHCDCGTERAVIGSDLRFGKSVSCGCLSVETTVARSRTHGETKTRLYTCWQNMRARCGSDNPNYGGRGITVCAEWGNFEPFRDWALAN